MSDGEYTIDEALNKEIPKKVREELDALRTTIQRLQHERHYIAPVRSNSNTVRFAAIADIHTGSLYERYDALEAFYNILDKEKITTVLNAGDILDGDKIYKGQEFELYAHGLSRQIGALKRKYPRHKNHRTIFITGNHDYSFDRQVDAGVGKAIEEEMGWEYAGPDAATVRLVAADGQEYLVGLYHPDGGTAYAISYKSQKIAESLPGGQKPDMLLIGHYHKAEWLPRYRNIEILQAGCFQSQTPHMARKPTPAHVGGWLIEVTIGNRENLTGRVKAEFISFYEPKDTEQ